MIEKLAELSAESSIGWDVFQTEFEGKMHVMPSDDLFPHLYSTNCWCNPSVQEGGNLIVHNSFDLREYFEQDAPEC
jgi:hypothetical protein